MNLFAQYLQMKVQVQSYSRIKHCSSHADLDHSVRHKLFLIEKKSRFFPFFPCLCLARPFISVDRGRSAVLVSHFSYFTRLF